MDYILEQRTRKKTSQGSPDPQGATLHSSGVNFSLYSQYAHAVYLLLFGADGSLLETLLWQHSNARRWEEHAHDLTAYAGRTLTLHYEVFNDGAGGVAGMYVDDVSLVVD